ncbi:uncharacterized protein LOC110367530 isoform X2 [Fundulus heteroclitus]|uniref:uncharacterized protein LOC110367530 isoform X2 n=1 Tax=Fundulus heteroclitus TaxID=8078 RepID=UPI00165ABEF5|nr:uncharacterized protein LOC110367530 isoform X2 [Fundulus heteroclitus]
MLSLFLNKQIFLWSELVKFVVCFIYFEEDQPGLWYRDPLTSVCAFLQKMSGKTNSVCPLCKISFIQLGKHLRATHNVLNLKEKNILARLGSKKMSIRDCPCPVPGCNYLSGKHLDRHLLSYHSELSNENRSKMAEHARFLLALNQLAKLRASNPSTPMVSTLDLENPPQPAINEPQVAEPAEDEMDLEQCRHALARYKEEVVHLRRENMELCGRVQELNQALSTAKRIAAGLKKGPAVVSKSVLHPCRTSAGTSKEQGGDAQQSTSDLLELSADRPPSSPPSPAESSNVSPDVSTASSVHKDEEEKMMEEEILLKPKMSDHPRIRRRSSTTRKLPMTSSGWCTWSTGRGRGNLMHRLVLPRSMEAYVERYRSYHTSRYGSSKMREGVVSRISRLKSFLRYMADGHKLISNWKFMFHIGRINRWLVELSKSGKEARRDLKRAIFLHQNRVKRAKMNQVPQQDSILR